MSKENGIFCGVAVETMEPFGWDWRLLMSLATDKRTWKVMHGQVHAFTKDCHSKRKGSMARWHPLDWYVSSFHGEHVQWESCFSKIQLWPQPRANNYNGRFLHTLKLILCFFFSLLLQMKLQRKYETVSNNNIYIYITYYDTATKWWVLVMNTLIYIESMDLA